MINQSREQKLKSVLSVSRDSGALGLAPWSNVEVASVSVLADGKKLTAFLGCAPETNQVTLSTQLTSLLNATIWRCGDQLPAIVYVSDAGRLTTIADALKLGKDKAKRQEWL